MAELNAILVVMSSEKPWMWSVFSKEEIDELVTNSSRIMWDEENGLVINITLNNNQCMEFLHHYHMTRDSDVYDTMESTIFVEDFLFDFASYIEDHLDRETPGWQEKYYGVDDGSEED